MSEPIYRRAFAESWHFVWHNKILWIFGLLAAFLGQFGLGDFAGRVIMTAERSLIPDNFFFVLQYSKTLLAGGLSGQLAWLWLAVAAACFGVLVIFVAVSAQGAMIVAATDWLKNGHQDKLPAAWRKSVRRFWPLLVLNLAQKVLLCGLIALLAVVWGQAVFASWTTELLIILETLAIFFAGFTVMSVFIYAAGYLLADNLPIGRAVQKGAVLYAHHLLVSVELAAIFFFLTLILVGFFVTASFVLFIPSVLIWLLGAVVRSPIIITLGVTVGFLLFILFTAWVGALYNVYTTSVWMYCFMKMKKEGLVSRVLHWFSGLI